HRALMPSCTPTSISTKGLVRAPRLTSHRVIPFEVLQKSSIPIPRLPCIRSSYRGDQQPHAPANWRRVRTNQELSIIATLSLRDLLRNVHVTQNFVPLTVDFSATA